MWALLYRLASPKSFYFFAGRLIPWFAGITLILFIYGLIGGLLFSPPDYQQGEAFRIIYIHVPAAFLSMGVYSSMAVVAVIGWVWKIKLADIMVKASAPIGAWFTFLALFTGAVWGKPMWGTWWIWDARLTSELILLFFYLGFIALQSAIADTTKAAKAGALLLLIGLVNLPIIHFSVEWWETLHQGATLSKFSKPSIALEMLYPLVAMILAFAFYYVTVVLMRARCEVLLREQRTQWVKELIAKESK